ncbi:ComF family protein [Candidatus Woesebacteria bacterium]|nr:ComF family protein [Candidatus Woesebacteria bacterium]
MDKIPDLYFLKPSSLDRLISVWNYDGVIRKAIIALKYKFASDVAKELADQVNLILKTKNLKNVVLVPIPLHESRKRWRGFNQSEEIGKLIAVSMDWEFAPNLLKRVFSTKPQVGLKEKERVENVKDVFVLNSSYIIHPTSYIIFDDVWTTGSTLQEAAKVLKTCLRRQETGAKEVWGLTVAR